MHIYAPCAQFYAQAQTGLANPLLRRTRIVAAELHQAVSRRAAILRILRETTVRNQEELVKALRKHGFDATQSSVSRDLRELGVAKAGDHYIVPDDPLRSE